MLKTKTQLARQIMRANGKYCMYTNKYKNCRTVKCYSFYQGAPKDKKLIRELEAAGFTVKTLYGNRPYTYGSIIARVAGLENTI